MLGGVNYFARALISRGIYFVGTELDTKFLVSIALIMTDQPAIMVNTLVMKEFVSEPLAPNFPVVWCILS